MMKKITLIVLVCFLFACNDSASDKKNPSAASSPKVKVSVKKEEKKVEADLSTPLVAYKSCIDALRKRDRATLSRCLSLPPGEKLNKRIALANLGYKTCGGYDREVLSVTEIPPGGEISPDRPAPPAESDKIWVNYVNPHPKCQNSIRMTKVGNEWRLYGP